MNRLEALLKLSKEEKVERGVLYTPSEIAQQGDTIRECGSLLAKEGEQLLSFLSSVFAEKREVILSGAGSSAFVGEAGYLLLKEEWQLPVMPVPTTTLLTHPKAFVSKPSLIIHFGRSGDSPESVAVYQLIKRLSPQSKHLIITCNSEGALAQQGGEDPLSYVFLLPPRTNDRSLVMTSSYTAMLFSLLSLPFLNDKEKIVGNAAKVSRAVTHLIRESSTLYQRLGEGNYPRIAYLGSGPFMGMLREAALKMAEMNDAQISVHTDTFLGLRHGPQVFIDSNTLVVAHLSEDNYIRSYELDLLYELRSKNQGKLFFGVTPFYDGRIASLTDVSVVINGLSDSFRLIPDLVGNQLLALFVSLRNGFKPDNPSPGGVINRVVSGVNIYPWDNNDTSQ